MKEKIISALSAIALSSILNSASPAEKPNIVILVADDLGWNDVGFHGSNIRTPSLDQLAAEGVQLNRFYTAPVCSPSRAGLLTGQYPDRFNLRDHVLSPRHKGGIPSEAIFIPEMLEKAGYKQRAAFGKWHLGHADYKYHPNSQGFTYFYGHYNGAIDYYTHRRDAELDWHRNNKPCFDKGYSTSLIEKEVVRFIKKAKSDSPFFAYVAFNAPHSPMQAEMEELENYGYDPNGSTEGYPVVQGHQGERGMDTYGLQGRGNNLRQTYSAMVSAMDKSIGHILQALKEKGIEENTFVWFLSDNGGIYQFGGDNQPLRGAKHSEWEGGVRSVSVVKWPDALKGGHKTNELISYIDVLPTLEKIVTGTINTETDGVDAMPALKGDTLPERFLFLGNSAIVSKKWKMNKGELFLIEEDISERNDIAKENPKIVAKMNEQVAGFSKMRPDSQPEMQPENWNPPENWTMPGQ